MAHVSRTWNLSESYRGEISALALTQQKSIHIDIDRSHKGDHSCSQSKTWTIQIKAFSDSKCDRSSSSSHAYSQNKSSMSFKGQSSSKWNVSDSLSAEVLSPKGTYPAKVSTSQVITPHSQPGGSFMIMSPRQLSTSFCAGPCPIDGRHYGAGVVLKDAIGQSFHQHDTCTKVIRKEGWANRKLCISAASTKCDGAPTTWEYMVERLRYTHHTPWLGCMGPSLNVQWMG